VLAAMLLAGRLVADPSVRYAVTVPGPAGAGVAFGAELLISFLLMTVVLAVSNHRRHARLTGLCAGLLVATFITPEAPLPGRRMKRRIWVVGLVALGGIGWYLFRPELLFVNKKVNESLTVSGAVAPEGMTMAAPSAPAALLTGRFHSVAHATKGTATVHDLGG